MEDNKLLSRIEELENRVSLLEQKLNTIVQINQSEKVKEYIASAAKATKIAKLLDISSKEERMGDEARTVSDSLSEILISNGINAAKDYVKEVEKCVANEIDKNEKIINQYDWDSIFEYYENNGSIVIKSYVGFDDTDTVIIPLHINNMKVTEIGEAAFKNCKGINEVILHSGIVSIGKEAFYGSGLKIINLPEGVEQIEEGAFRLTNLISIHIPSTVKKIGRSAFAFNDQLKNITFSEGITYIDREVFYHCTSLKKIDIPPSVTSIGASALGYIGDFTNYRKNNISVNIRIPNSVKNLHYVDGLGYDHNIFSMNCGTGNERLTIYCNSGSIAMKYARDLGIQVKKYEEFDLLKE